VPASFNSNPHPAPTHPFMTTKTFFLIPYLITMISAAICLPVDCLEAQSAPIPPPPPPDLSLVPPDEAGPVALITFANSTSVRTRSRGGHFHLAGIHPSETVNVRLQFPLSFAGTTLAVSTLDGGEARVQRQNSLIAADGTTSLQFKASDQPGLYRVLIAAGASHSVLKFWVADPNNPKNNQPVLQPDN
jgi:hypothetical protein